MIAIEFVVAKPEQPTSGKRVTMGRATPHFSATRTKAECLLYKIPVICFNVQLNLIDLSAYLMGLSMQVNHRCVPRH